MPEPRHPQLPRAPHGGPDAQPFGGCDFSVNANPFGPNPALFTAAQAADYAGYPDPALRAVRETLAAWHGGQPGQVVPAVGASELLHRFARAYLNPGDRAVSVLVPFGEFARAAALQRAELLTVDPVEAEAAIRAQHPTLVYLCRPHNPLGVSLPVPDVMRLADACADTGALLILDEAYAALDPELTPVPPHPHVARLHSPGKLHGLVGLRPAYAVAPLEVAAHLTNLAPAWALPAPTLAVLHALPAAQSFVQDTLPKWQQVAAQLKAELSAFLTVHDAGLPFFTVEVGDAARVAAQLLTRGVRVRDCTSYGWPQRIRVSARRPLENARLVQSLREVPGG